MQIPHSHNSHHSNIIHCNCTLQCLPLCSSLLQVRHTAECLLLCHSLCVYCMSPLQKVIYYISKTHSPTFINNYKAWNILFNFIVSRVSSNSISIRLRSLAFSLLHKSWNDVLNWTGTEQNRKKYPTTQFECQKKTYSNVSYRPLPYMSFCMDVDGFVATFVQLFSSWLLYL